MGSKPEDAQARAHANALLKKNEAESKKSVMETNKAGKAGTKAASR